MGRTAWEMGAWFLAGTVASRLLVGLLGAHAEGAALTLVGGGMLATSFLRRARTAGAPGATEARS
jgi:hypothetical protein